MKPFTYVHKVFTPVNFFIIIYFRPYVNIKRRIYRDTPGNSVSSP